MHLFEGDDADNAIDRDAKGRHRALRGMEAPWTKMEYFAVREALALSDTAMTTTEIAALYGVSASHISYLRAKDGRTRKPMPSGPIRIGEDLWTVAEVAKTAGVGTSTIYARLGRGLTGDALLAGKHRAERKNYTRKT